MPFWSKWAGSSHLVGLDIGSHTLKMVQLRAKKSAFELVKFATIGLPKGTLVDGEILDAFTLEEVLKELYAKEGIRSKEIAFAISGNAVISKKIAIPKTSIPELNNQLSVIAAQYIPFATNEIRLDYQLTPQMELILVAVKQKFLDAYLSVIEAADLKPVTVETMASALANIYAVNHSENALLIHLGACWTQWVLVENGLAVFDRNLPIGGNHITEDLREKLNLSFAEAEALKISCYKEKHLPRETLEVIKQSCQNLCNQIQHTLNLYTRKSPDTEIEKIFISGGTSKIIPLREWIAEATGIETHPLKAFSAIQYDPKKWDQNLIEELEALAPVALGLATRSAID